MNVSFNIGDWVTRNFDCGIADGIAEELSINTSYEVITKLDSGYLMLRYFSLPVNPIYLRASTPQEKLNQWQNDRIRETTTQDTPYTPDTPSAEILALRLYNTAIYAGDTEVSLAQSRTRAIKAKEAETAIINRIETLEAELKHEKEQHQITKDILNRIYEDAMRA